MVQDERMKQAFLLSGLKQIKQPDWLKHCKFLIYFEQNSE